MAITGLIPWRRASSLRTDPLSTMTAFQREMNRMFEDFWGDGGRAMTEPTEGAGIFMPSVEVSETDKEVVVSAEIPGMTEKDIDVSMSPDRAQLTISGEKKLEKKREEENFYQCERTYGAFRRTVALPSMVKDESVDATYKNGVLEIRLQKAEEGKGVTHIKVRKA